MYTHRKGLRVVLLAWTLAAVSPSCVRNYECRGFLQLTRARVSTQVNFLWGLVCQKGGIVWNFSMTTHRFLTAT